MLNRFEFATAGRIIFGEGAVGEVPSIVRDVGRRSLVVTGRSPIRAARLFGELLDSGVEYVTFSVSGEPTTDMVCRGSELARESGCDVVVAIGGGSVLDAGKAIAALLTNGCQPYEFLEVIGKGKPLVKPPAPYFAIPTTAGTGAEVTRNAVLLSPEHRVKVSLRSPLMLPRLAVIDPELTHNLPPNLTAMTGLDALTQVIEPFVSNHANPMTDGFCREGLLRASRALLRAYRNGDDVEARSDMALTGLLGGLALANARLGAVHGFAGVIGGMFSAPHGAVCARLLPHVMAVNVRALRKREPRNEALHRYDEIARLVTGRDSATAEDGVAWVDNLVGELDIPPLSVYGISERDFPVLVERAQAASSMKGNPLRLTAEELTEVLIRSL